MKKHARILSLLLSVVMVLGMIVPTMAAEATKPTVYVEKVEQSDPTLAVFDVKITGNTGMSEFTVEMEYTEGLTLKEIQGYNPTTYVPFAPGMTVAPSNGDVPVSNFVTGAITGVFSIVDSGLFRMVLEVNDSAALENLWVDFKSVTILLDKTPVEVNTQMCGTKPTPPVVVVPPTPLKPTGTGDNLTWSDAEGDYFDDTVVSGDKISDVLKDDLGTKTEVNNVDLNIEATDNNSVQDYLEQLEGDKATVEITDKVGKKEEVVIVVAVPTGTDESGKTVMQAVEVKLNDVEDAVEEDGKVTITYANLYAALVKKLAKDETLKNLVVTEFQFVTKVADIPGPTGVLQPTSTSTSAGNTYDDPTGMHVEDVAVEDDQVDPALADKLDETEAEVYDFGVTQINATKNADIYNYLNQIEGINGVAILDVDADDIDDAEILVKVPGHDTVISLKLSALNAKNTADGVTVKYADLYKAIVDALGENAGFVTNFQYVTVVEEEEEPQPQPKPEPAKKTDKMIFPNLYKVSVDCGEGGKVNTSEEFLIARGASRTIKITADEGYEVEDILVNGKSVGAAEKYTIKGASKNYTVAVIFAEIED